MTRSIISYILVILFVSSCNSSSEQSIEPKSIVKEYYADPVSSVIHCNLEDLDGGNSYLYKNEDNVDVSIYYSDNLIVKFNDKPAYVFVDSVLVDSIQVQSKIKFVLDSINISFQDSDEHLLIVTPNKSRKYGVGLNELELRLQIYKSGSKKAEIMFNR